MPASKLGRRGFLGSSLLLGAAGCSRSTIEATPQAPGACASGGGVLPLAQDYTIAAQVPDDGKHYYMHDPGMVILPSGKILVAAPCWEIVAPTSLDLTSNPFRVYITLSSDGGRTWETIARLDGTSDATPFVHAGKLYMFVQNKQFEGGFNLTTSVDGATWSPPKSMLDGSYWNCSTSMVTQNGKLYWAVQSKGIQDSVWQGSVSVLAADASMDLLDRRAWQKSRPLEHPATPSGILPAGHSGAGDWWLEPNTVSVNGKIRVILRTVLDGYKTTSLPVVCDLDETDMTLTFAQFCPAPGGQNKCFIVKDEGGLFWMLSNLAADSQETVLDWSKVRANNQFLGGGGNDRRFLMLSYSIDALNWFPAGCVARAGLLRQSFMYPSAAIDGEDLVLISRTSADGGTQHNADLVTFHRIKNFRALAMNLYPDA